MRVFILGTADPGTGRPDSMFFTRAQLHDLVASGDLYGIKVWFEHGDHYRDCLGRVEYAWVDPTHGLKLIISFDTSDVCAGTVFEWIKRGVFRGLSLGYAAAVDQRSFAVTGKRVHEVSVVQTPFHPTCRIDAVVEGA